MIPARPFPLKIPPALLAAHTGLRPTDLAYIRAVLAREPAVVQAWIYGSRARGTHRPGSDVDLALAGTVSDAAVARLRYALEETGPLPYCFDLTRLSELGPAHPLRAQIAADGLALLPE